MKMKTKGQTTAIACIAALASAATSPADASARSALN